MTQTNSILSHFEKKNGSKLLKKKRLQKRKEKE